MIDARALVTATRSDLARFPRVLSALLDGLEPALWPERPAASEWSPLEIVCHLRDEEVEDFGARVRVVERGGDRFVPIDPERWAVERRYREVEPAAALAAFTDRRAANVEYLATVTPERLRAALASGTATLSGLDVLAAWVTHDRLHLAQLAATLARLGARRWAPLRAEYAGPIPYAEG
jgi:hypothetical protein